MIYRLENVSKIYNQNNVALDNVDLEIKEGEIMVVLGPSGSGKSTLLNILSGLDYPSGGKVFYRDERVDQKDESEITEYRYHDLGFVFQSYNLMSTLTAKENIELGKVVKDEMELKNIIKKLGLEEHQDKYPYQLSGGQMQRVAIARSLIKNPKVIFCDEPTGALDEKIGKIILKELQKINREKGTTIIIVTHNPSIGKMANVVVKMNSGKIVEQFRNANPIAADELRWV